MTCNRLIKGKSVMQEDKCKVNKDIVIDTDLCNAEKCELYCHKEPKFQYDILLTKKQIERLALTMEDYVYYDRYNDVDKVDKKILKKLRSAIG